MRSFGLHLLSSLTRVSGDFLRTSWGLLRHPWKVVRDYIYGRRVGLISPVSMLLLLALYWGAMVAIVPHFSQSDQIESLTASAWIKWLYSSVTFQYLFLAIPIAVGTWVVYGKDIRGRFNFAELLIATLYLASTYLLLNFILLPAELLNEWLSNVMVIIVTGLYGLISILKAFPQPTWKKAACKLALFSVVCGVLLLLFLLLFAIPVLTEVVAS